ncbi:MAG: HAMP domain-containing protein [Burkholderiales bacterium]|nr:HAMP domain-containing protein [Burkholderiales bacterium]
MKFADLPEIAERWHCWPRTLFGRLMLILFSELLLAHAFAFALAQMDSRQAAKDRMFYTMGKDVASAVAILERLPPAERSSWLSRLARSNYDYALRPATAAVHPIAGVDIVDEVLATVRANLGESYPISATSVEGDTEQLRMEVHLQLHDGTPLTVTLSATPMKLSFSLFLLLILQLALLALVTWFAVRLATRPLKLLANAATNLGENWKASAPLKESGPQELVQAAKAFNTMQSRITKYLTERMQILAAVSHDLQTPITRLRLRLELMDDQSPRDNMLRDLDVIQHLVERGITYARSQNPLQRPVEPSCRIDLNALLRSTVYDYQDAGHTLRLHGALDEPVTSQPHVLRRVLTNLIDNALKFATDVEIVLAADGDKHVAITIQDRGPGIPENKMSDVFQPFCRLEDSRNSETGGSGLGLAIVQQLVLNLQASLSMTNREGGGLAVRLRLPRNPP